MPMQIPEPLVSVIMGVRYQKEDLALLERAVRSVLEQSSADFEFLICDNGSTSKAMAYLKSVSTTDSRVKLVRQEGCLDLARKLNQCLHIAKGTYIARMDDDDYSHPDRLEKQLDFLRQNEAASFVGCNVALIQNGKKVGQRMLPPHPTVEDFYFVQPYIHPTLVFRREALEAVGGYSEDRRQILCEDYDLLLRLYAQGYQGSNLQEILLDYTLPTTAKGNRKMRHRWNEAVTRYRRFKELKRLPRAWLYVVKPLAVGLVPKGALEKIKKKRDSKCG